MLDVRYSTRFKKDFKLCVKCGYKMPLLQQAIDTLSRLVRIMGGDALISDRFSGTSPGFLPGPDFPRRPCDADCVLHFMTKVVFLQISFELCTPARPSACVFPESPMSLTKMSRFSLITMLASIQSACTGSTKKQWTLSLKICFKPNVMPPGAPLTPHSKKLL